MFCTVGLATSSNIARLCIFKLSKCIHNNCRSVYLDIHIASYILSKLYKKRQFEPSVWQT